MKKYKRAITYGTFDLFHIGHLKLLKRISDIADEVYVAISTDEFNLGKNKVCTIPYEQRAEIVASLRMVNKVIPEETWEQKSTDVIMHSIDLFVMGDDWAGKFDFLKEYCDVIYLPRTEGISSTQIKMELKTNS